MAFQALPFPFPNALYGLFSRWIHEINPKVSAVLGYDFLFLFRKCRNVWLSAKVNTSAEQRVGGRVTDLLLGLEDETAAEGRGRRRIEV